MVLASHSYAAYLNASKVHSRAGAHIMLSKDTTVPTRNGPVLTVSQIIKLVMSSAAEAEISGLFICAKAMVHIRQTLINMVWPYPKYPIQCDTITSVDVSYETIIQHRTKTMNMQYHWLHFREAQGQFWFFWAPGANNISMYSTKNHPPIYHKSHRPTHAG